MPVLEWPEPACSPQHIDIDIKEWSLGVDYASLTTFSFRGQCMTSPLKGLDVNGHFESHNSRSSLLSRLPDHWRSIPELADATVWGWGHIQGIDRHEPGFPPTLGFRLFCAPGGLEWVYRAFLAAFVNDRNSLCPLGLSLAIDPPDAGHDISDDRPVADFWRERWKSEDWRVVYWELGADFSRRDQ